MSRMVEIVSDEFETPLKRLANGFYHVVDQYGKKVQFRTNWAQEELLSNLHTLNIVLKARQLGFSTAIDMLALDQAVWNENLAAGIIAHTLPDVKKIFESKVQFPWESLHADFRNSVGSRTDASNELTFKNGSSVRVGTSLRSSTLQFLHISEYGKICAKFPDKAREIRSGALNTLHSGAMAFIESTAEGREGDFYNKSVKALGLIEDGRTLSTMDWKFHFFAWWQHAGYTLSPEDTLRVVIDATMAKYFQRIEDEHDIILTRGQKAWYAMKEDEQRGDMRREFPSYPEEAFEVAIEGAYYSRQMKQVRKDGRITIVPHDPRRPVHTSWDIGRNDSNAIWFFQDGPGGTFHMIGFYENNNESMQFYGRHMQKLADDNDGWYYGTTYLPGDGVQTDYTREDGKSRAEVFTDMGFRTQVVPFVSSNAESGEGVQAVRDVLPLCVFDEEKCSGRPREDERTGHTGGIEALDGYQKEWNDRQGAYRDYPAHNWASHGAKAFETFARGHVYGAGSQDGTTGNSGRYKQRSWKTA